MARNPLSYRAERKAAARHGGYMWRALPSAPQTTKAAPLLKFGEETRVDLRTGEARPTCPSPHASKNWPGYAKPAKPKRDPTKLAVDDPAGAAGW